MYTVIHTLKGVVYLMSFECKILVRYHPPPGGGETKFYTQKRYIYGNSYTQSSCTVQVVGV